jgi:hypothetical protein
MTVADVAPFSTPVTVVDGVNTYTYAFDAYDIEHVKVQVTASDGDISYLTYGTDYSVVAADAPSIGGTVTVTASLTAGDEVVLYRDTDLAQVTNLPNQGAYFAETVEREFDRQAMVTQEQSRDNDLALAYPLGSTADAVFPEPIDGRTLVGRDVNGTVKFKADGPLVTELSAVSAIIAEIDALADIVTEIQGVYAVRDDITTLAALDTQLAALADIETELTALAAIDTEISALYAIRADISAVEAVVAHVTTVAGLDTEVAAVAAISTEIEAVYDNLTAVQNAAANAVAAADTLAEFEALYLGYKTSDPALDNEGNALVNGALYWNSGNEIMRLYDNGWRDASAQVTRNLYEYTATSGQTAITGADRHSNVLATGDKFLNVHVNGLRLTPTDDYTFTDTTITLASGLNADDEILVEAITSFEVADAVKITAQTLTDAEKSQARDNIDVGLVSGYRNKIINGDFDIWQRGTSQTLNDYDSADRWRVASTGSTKTFSRQSFALGQTDVDGSPTYYSRNVVSSITGAGNFAILSQRIEGVKTLSGKTATLTFYAKSDAAKNMAVELSQSFGTGGSPSADVNEIGSQLVALTTSWQKFSVTIDIPNISGKTLGTDGNDFLQVFFWFDAGSTYDSRSASLGQQSGTFDIAHVSLVEGDATEEDDPFSPRHIAQEIALCERYFCKSMQLETAPANSLATPDCISGHLGAYASTHAYSPLIPFPQRMRGIPTISHYSSIYATTDSKWSIFTGAWNAATANNAESVTETGFRAIITGSWGSYSDNNAVLFQAGYTADAEL